jgi:tetratricopeptide (TPR) repeat protein
MKAESGSKSWEGTDAGASAVSAEYSLKRESLDQSFGLNFSGNLPLRVGFYYLVGTEISRHDLLERVSATRVSGISSDELDQRSVYSFNRNFGFKLYIESGLTFRGDNYSITVGLMGGLDFSYGGGGYGGFYLLTRFYPYGKKWTKIGKKSLVEGYLSAGDDAYGERSYSEAIRQYAEAIKIEPRNIRASYQLACCYALCGRPDQALSWLEYACKLDRSLAGKAWNDKDLSSLRSLEAFKKLTGR